MSIDYYLQVKVIPEFHFSNVTTCPVAERALGSIPSDPTFCRLLAYKWDNASSDGSVASTMASPVFHTHADTEGTWLQTTSVEPLGSENFGRS